MTPGDPMTTSTLNGPRSPLPTPGCQRWSAGRQSFRPPGETIDPGRHEVAPIDEATAKKFVVTHHYSRSYPAARARFGLFRQNPGRPAELAGVCVFSVPMNQRAIPRHTGQSPEQGCELGRFVLLDAVEANGESWFLARCLRELPDLLPGVRAVISYADPMTRRAADGNLITPGHIGTIYQALSAHYRGRSSRRTLWLAPDGTVLSGRMLSKLSGGERGAAHAYATLHGHGAPARRPLEADAAYLRRALIEGPFTRRAHPGNHVYTFAAGRPADRRKTRDTFPESLTYPKALCEA